MTRIVAIAGSLRAHSFNLGLLHAMHEVAPEGVDLDVRTLHGVPLYNADEEAESGVPPSVQTLKEAVAGSDGLILATPEYNNGVPGVFKNAIDWMSRPAADIGRVFGGRPVALLGASPGGFGTVLSQNAWLPVLRTLGARPWFDQKLMVSRAGGLFDEEGRLTDAATRDRLKDFIQAFDRFVSEN